MNDTDSLPTPAAVMPRAVAVPVLLLGPVLSCWAVTRLYSGSILLDGLGSALLAVLVLGWSPWPMSVPALVLQDARDAALATWRGPRRVLRAVVLIPWLCCSPRSSVRAESVAALLGLAAGVFWSLPHLGWHLLSW